MLSVNTSRQQFKIVLLFPPKNSYVFMEKCENMSDCIKKKIVIYILRVLVHEILLLVN